MSYLKNQRAYTLIELSVSLAILAIMLTGILAIFFKKDESERYRITIERMAKIEEALANYVDRYYSLPCPARGDYLESDSNYGYVTNYNSPNCNLIPSNVGQVPVRTLALPDYYAYDGWERKFSFSIAAGMGSLSDMLSGSYLGDIRIIDLQGVNKIGLDKAYPNNNGAAYILLSFGQNGIGAWQKNNSNTPSLPSTSSREYENADYLSGNPNKTFIQDDRNYLFGHILRYRMLSELIDVKYQRSPIKIPNKTCNNVNSILSDSAATYSLTTSSAKIAFAASALSKFCNNQPKSSLSLVPTNIPVSSNSFCVNNPSSVANLQLWLDANDVNGNGSTLNDGQHYTSWIDKSTNAYIVADPSNYGAIYTSNSPFKKGSLFFNSNPYYTINNNLSFLTNTSYSFFIVYATYPINGSNAIIGSNAGSANQALHFLTRYNGSVFRHYWGQWSNDTSVIEPEYPYASQTTSLPYMAMAVFNNATPQRILNIRSNNGFASKAVYSGDATYLNQSYTPYIGRDGSNYYSGYVAEIIMYSRALNSDEQKLIEGYLLRKWFSGECS